MISDEKQVVNPFSSMLVEQIDLAIERIVTECKPPFIAAFDADGTLWNTDVGELLFHYQINKDVLELTKDEILSHYERLFAEKNHENLYRWQAELNGGYKVSIVDQWIELSQNTEVKPTVFQNQCQLIQKLRDKGFTVYVVSASFAPTVAYAAQTHFGLPAENIVAVTLPIRDETYLDKSVETITSGPGKVARLLSATQGLKPHFSCGNTLSDLDLLETASHFRLAVRTVESTHRNYQSEQGLYQWALKKNWAHHCFSF